METLTRFFCCVGLVLLCHLSIACRSSGVSTGGTGAKTEASPRLSVYGWGNALILPLPEGWRELESSEVPKSDRQPWWTLNPIVLQGPEASWMAACLPEIGNPVKVLAIAYMYKHDESTLTCMFALKYDSQQQADAQYQKMRKDGLEIGDSEVATFGLSKSDDGTILIMISQGSIPDRDYFDQYFQSITSEVYIPRKRQEYVEKIEPEEASEEAWAWCRSYVIPREKLPKGWRLMVKDELPPSFCFPWWKKNPMVIERQRIRDYALRGFLELKRGTYTKATMIASVGYAYGPPKAGDEIRLVPYVQVIVLRYKDPEEAKQELGEFPRHEPFHDFDWRGFSLRDKEAIVLMWVQDHSPNKEFFEQLFRSIARPGTE